MTGFLDLPLELRNHVYEFLLNEHLNPVFRGVMVVSEAYITANLPLRSYRGLLRVCRQIYHEFKQAIQHMVASKQITYELDMTFSHGRPFFSITWIRFPALSPTVNSLHINIDLRTGEPFRDGIHDSVVPHAHELAHLLEDSEDSFAGMLFDYLSVLLKTLAALLHTTNPASTVLYTESVTLNLRSVTKMVGARGALHNNPVAQMSRRIRVDALLAQKLHGTMRNTLGETSKAFGAYEARECWRLVPLIQVGALRYATDGVVWGEGHNLVLAHDDFMWLRYD